MNGRRRTQLVRVLHGVDGKGDGGGEQAYPPMMYKNRCFMHEYFVVMDSLNVMLGHKVPGTCLRARVGISDRGVYLSYDLNVGAVLPDFAKNKRCSQTREKERERRDRGGCVRVSGSK